MRHIYVDESGTSSREPIAVVAAIVVHTETEWRVARDSLRAVMERHVPSDLWPTFIFHATDILRGRAPFDGEDWSIDRRIEVICEVLDIISSMKLPIALAWFPKASAWGNRVPPVSTKQNPVPTKNDMAHLISFAKAISLADQYIAEFGDDDVASVIAEDSKQMRRWLRRAPEMLLVAERADPDFYRPLTNVINGIQFFEKSEGPLLQLADAAAFAWRRYLYRHDFGDLFRQHLMGLHQDFRIGTDYTAQAGGATIYAEHVTPDRYSLSC